MYWLQSWGMVEGRKVLWLGASDSQVQRFQCLLLLREYEYHLPIFSLL